MSTAYSERTTRSKSKPLPERPDVIDLTLSSPITKVLATRFCDHPPVFSTFSQSLPGTRSVKIYSEGQTLPNITKAELPLLRQKQQRLKSTTGTVIDSLEAPLLAALLSTLILAADHAGTAVLVHKSGLVVTCAHCFAESQAEYDSLTVRTGKRKWALFYDGTAALLELAAWDGQRDLVLCKIIALQTTVSFAALSTPEFQALSLSSSAPKRGANIYCIGQPGAEDLESDVPGTKTKYNLFEISEGRFRGLVKGQDVNRNDEIGCLMHDAWTYWGHSGAPLFTVDEEKAEVRLIGLHSSWDDKTAMRHGVPWEAVRDFLKENEDVMEISFGLK